jgi:hypothetical protein
MYYGDLIQFEPIESVIQLLDANRPEEAKKLVENGSAKVCHGSGEIVLLRAG